PGHMLLRSGTQPDAWRTHDELATGHATSESLGQPPGSRRLAASARRGRPCSAHRFHHPRIQFLGIVVELPRDVADSRWRYSNSRDRLGLRRYGNRSADWRVVGTERSAPEARSTPRRNGAVVQFEAPPQFVASNSLPP